MIPGKPSERSRRASARRGAFVIRASVAHGVECLGFGSEGAPPDDLVVAHVALRPDDQVGLRSASIAKILNARYGDYTVAEIADLVETHSDLSEYRKHAQLSAELAEAGNPPTSVRTSARAHFDPTNGGFEISRIELSTVGKVPGIDETAFVEHANSAKENCPVSKALAVQITLEATLAS